MRFDPDALLAALPHREIKSLSGLKVRRSPRDLPTSSALRERGQYNGFTIGERNRTADVSKKLVASGATMRHATCDICRAAADHEHAENYYDLSSWIGMCKSCHVHALHKRFTNPSKWAALLDRHQVGGTHWARLVSLEPFDLALLLRDRGAKEPTLGDFAA